MPERGIWWSQDPRTSEWGRYAPDDNEKIEASYNGSKAPVQLDFCGNVFTVDVKKMEQRNSTGGSRKIRRDVEKVAAPKASPFKASGGAGDVEYVKTTFLGGNAELGVAAFGTLFEALGLDGGSAEPFVFFHRMEPGKPWAITAEELASGLAAAGSPKATQADVKKMVAKWMKGASTNYSEFEAMYKFCFEFCRNSSGAATIPSEEAVGFLSVLLQLCPGKKGKVEPLVDFLGSTPNISRDLWKHLPQFLRDVKADLSNYDDFFFPTQLDTYVEAQQKK